MTKRTQIFVMKRRSGVEHIIPVWNLGGYIETHRKRSKGWLGREILRLFISGKN